MILALRTDDKEVEIALADGDEEYSMSWYADRELAKGLLAKITELLKKHHVEFSQLQGIIVYKGPGSFTGLRIGCTVANTMAYSLSVPIVGADTSDWKKQGLYRLKNNENDQVVLPIYGRDPRITQPKR